jgi:acetyl-CoA C-acetyltransferase
MPYNTTAGVIGSASHAPITGGRRSLEEIIYDVGRAALADAGITIEDIDGIVVAANDQIDGRAISVMAASGSVGGVDRDILSTPSAGEHAFVLGMLRVASGQFRTQLIVSWSPTDVGSIPDAQRLGNDPYFHRRLPLDDLASNALQAGALAAAVPEAHDLALAIVKKNRRNGARAHPGIMALASEPGAISASRVTHWPLREAMVAPFATGAVALVIASDEFIAERGCARVAWVKGMGWATEPAFLGDRDLATAPALEHASRRAYEDAGISNPIEAFDVAEISDPTPYQELLAYEGLGLCPRAEWRERISAGDFEARGVLPVNLSGGAACINPVFCTGLMRIAEAADQVRGTAKNHQVAKVRTALAHAASGFAMQYQTVVVLGRDRPETPA